MGNHFLKTREETEAWLNKIGVSNYRVNADLTVDVDGDGVDISHKNLSSIPVQFGVVNGYFNCDNNKLTSLGGSPTACAVFNCGNNRLTNLVGAPKTCSYFWCHDNHLNNLEGAPRVCLDFVCSRNLLASLIGAPDKCKYFYAKNNQLTRLTGGPGQCIEMFVNCNKLTSLIGGPEECNKLHCSNNQLIDLAGVAVNCQYLDCNENPALWDVSAAPDGCELRYDRDVVAKNRAGRHLVALDTDTVNTPDVLLPRAGRIL